MELRAFASVRVLLATAFRTVALALLGGLVSAGAGATEVLQVDGRAAVPLWPAVTLQLDRAGALSLEQAIAQRHRFEVPTGTPGNLGRADGVVWLHATLHVPGVEHVDRVLDIDYPSLNRVDVYRLRDGRVADHLRLGNTLRMDERPLRARTHAAPLRLDPGTHELLLRVQTLSSTVLPLTLRTASSFTESESRVQLIQGVFLGLALCMLIYSLAHWVTLRDAVFLDYALLLVGNALFGLAYFGIGAQVLWPDWPPMSTKVAPVGILLAVAFGMRFMRASLDIASVSRIVDRVLGGATVAAVAGLALIFTDTLGYRAAQTLVTALGLSATVLVLPVAFVLARRGDRLAKYMLVGWAFYTGGAFTLAGLLRGHIEPTVWTQHLYPLSTMVEMAAWMAVLGLRVQAIHRNADRARVESEALRTLAHTDALTGLPNRRGLQDHLADALRGARPQALLAVYLLDLDGFKPINDRYGHDVGDALLVAVGGRLKAQLRGSDIVARLGGDEFVVLAAGLADERQAHALGQKLLAAFDEAFDADGHHCEVGLTVGYALAPLDGSTADELLKRADAAMYAGKQAGRRRVQRGGRAMAPI